MGCFDGYDSYAEPQWALFFRDFCEIRPWRPPSFLNLAPMMATAIVPEPGPDDGDRHRS
jgi:hypothetical protein